MKILILTNEGKAGSKKKEKVKADDYFRGTYTTIKKTQDIFKQANHEVDTYIMTSSLGLVKSTDIIESYGGINNSKLLSLRKQMLHNLENIFSRKSYDIVILLLPTFYANLLFPDSNKDILDILDEIIQIRDLHLFVFSGKDVIEKIKEKANYLGIPVTVAKKVGVARITKKFRDNILAYVNN